MTIMPNPFVDEDHRFVLDEAKFMLDVGYVPPAPPEEHLEEDDIEQILRALFARGA